MKSSSVRTRFASVSLSLALVMCGTTIAVAQPTLGEVFPPGLQIGGTTRITLTGTGLDNSLRVFLSDSPDLECPIEVHSVSDQSAELSLTLSATLEEGLSGIRLVTQRGVSNVAWVCLTQGVPTSLSDKEPAGGAADLPVLLHGRVSGDQRLHFPFHAEEGDIIIVQAWAKRIGSELRPVLRILDAADKQVAWQAPQPKLSQDALLAWRAPATGTYRLELHDVTYRAPGNSKFCVSLSGLPLRESVYPFSATLGKPFHGRLQSLCPIHHDPQQPLQSQLADKIALALDATYPGWYPVPNNLGDIKMLGTPRLWMDSLSEYREVEHEANQEQAISQPVAPLNIHGTLSAGEALDQYRVVVTPGQRLRCEVWAERMGSPLDGVLIVRDTSGKELGRSDDRPGTTDPEVVLTVPADTTALILELSDLTHATGDHYQYRIAVEDITQGEIRARVNTDRLSTFGSNTEVVPIAIDRQGCTQPVEIRAVDLPEGWTAEALSISGSADQGLLRLQSTSDERLHGSLSLVCFPIDRLDAATFVTFDVPDPVRKESPWLSRLIGIAAMEAPSIHLAAEALPTVESVVFAGGEWQISCDVDLPDRPAGGSILPADAQFRLRLLTSQQPIKKTIKVNNQDQVVDDLDRMLHLVGEPQFDDTKHADLRLAVPADLPTDRWQGVLILEAISADGNHVIARSAATPFEFEVKSAFRLSTPGLDKPIEVIAGSPISIAGTIERIEPFSGPVKLEVTGLPEGWSTEPQIIGDDAENFELLVQVPASQGAGEVNSLLLQATAESAEGEVPTKIASMVPRGMKVIVKAPEQPSKQ